MTTTARRSGLVSAVIAALLFAAACGGAGGAPQGGGQAPAGSSSQSKTPLAFTVATGLDYSQGVWLSVAEANGYFKEQGLDVTWKLFGSGAEASQTVAAGTAPIGLMAETPAIGLRAAGVPVVVVTEFTDYTQATDLFMAKEFTINRPEDLYGRKIAITAGSTSDAFFGQLLHHYNLDRSKIQVVNLSPPDAIAAYAQKQVDGGIYWEPWPASAESKRPTQVLANGSVSFFPSNKGQDVLLAPSFGVVVVREDFIRQHPDAVVGFLRALAKVQTFAQQNQDQAINIYLSKVKDTKANAEVSAKASPPRLQLPESLASGFQTVGAFLVNNGRVKSYPPLEGWLYSDPLKSVLPSAVQLQGTWHP